MTWPIAYILAWLVTAFAAAVLVRLCIALAPHLGLVDIPQHEAHKNHRRSTPVMGGAGMLAAWLLAICCALLAAKCLPGLVPSRLQSGLAGLKSVYPVLGPLLVGAVLVTFLGMLDDRKAMSALPKFLGQALVAGATCALGIHISFLHAIPGANYIVTILWIMTLMNAMNFFDNMDGLAAGASAIAAFFLLFVAGIRGQYFVGMLAAVTGGAATGFLVWNAPPARIFMGDGGSHFLGYLLALLGIMTTFYIPQECPTPAPILVPLLILGVPLFDAVAVVIIRLRLGVPIYKGDNRHISHRFVWLGLSRPQAVFLVLLLCLAVGSAAVTLLWVPPAGFFLVLVTLAAIFTIITLLQFHSNPEKQEESIRK